MSETQHDLLGKPIPAPKPSFEDWLAGLDAEATRRGYLGKPLSKQTGADCWRNAYADGMTPAAALDEDESYGE